MTPYPFFEIEYMSFLVYFIFFWVRGGKSCDAAVPEESLIYIRQTI